MTLHIYRLNRPNITPEYYIHTKIKYYIVKQLTVVITFPILTTLKHGIEQDIPMRKLCRNYVRLLFTEQCTLLPSSLAMFYSMNDTLSYLTLKLTSDEEIQYRCKTL